MSSSSAIADYHDISRLPLKSIEETPDRGLRIGALVPNSDVAYHRLIAQRYPISAILAGAVAQHGVDRRKFSAANALLLLLRYGDTLQ